MVSAFLGLGVTVLAGITGKKEPCAPLNEELPFVDSEKPKVIRVFSNNAVLATHDGTEQVIVGRGVGFGRHAGDSIEHGPHRYYVEASPDRIGFLQTLNEVPSRTLEVLSQALDMASDILDDLHPSVYIVLTDHLVFAVQRLKEGQVIHNTLSQEIKAVFPVEFAAAESVLHYINVNLGIELPEDEAAFIALHLNAARTGVTVKQPLEQANALAEIVQKIGAKFGISQPDAASAELVSVLAKTRQRLVEGRYRKNDATRSIRKDLPYEFDIASTTIRTLVNLSQLPRHLEGEAAYLAVSLHGWRQSY